MEWLDQAALPLLVVAGVGVALLVLLIAFRTAVRLTKTCLVLSVLALASLLGLVLVGVWALQR